MNSDEIYEPEAKEDIEIARAEDKPEEMENSNVDGEPNINGAPGTLELANGSRAANNIRDDIGCRTNW